jgi:predicted site-specific integrase-resolvase
MENKIAFDKAAEMLGVSRQTIYNYIERGLLKPHKAFNNRVFFDIEQVEKLLDLPFAEE